MWVLCTPENSFWIEVRGADGVPRDLVCALPALYKGLFYDDRARVEATDLVSDWGPGDRKEALVQVAERGLAARVAGEPILERAARLVEISAGGLGRLVATGLSEENEEVFLEPLRAIVQDGLSPGQEVLELWRGEWGGDMRQLIEYARY